MEILTRTLQPAFSLATKLISLALLATALYGCSTPYPMNMSKEQWEQLDPSQQTQLLLEQQKIQAEQAKAQQIAEKQRLEKLYANPTQGNVVRVNIEGGTWQENKKQYRIQAETLRIARGESKSFEVVKLNDKGYTSSLWIEYRMDGDAIYIKENRYDDQKIVLLNRNKWDCGDFYTAQLSDRYQNLNLKISVFATGNEQHCGGHRRSPPPMR